MWVRVATFEGVDKDKIDKLTQERMSSGEMTPPEGMNSILVLDDANAKKRKFLAFFDNKDAIDAAEAGFEQMGDTIPEDIRGKRTSVHHYEVVVQEGDIDAAKAARVSVLEGSPASIDDSVGKVKAETLPQVRELPGNVGAIGLADRKSGNSIVITLWESPDALRKTEQQADKLRAQAAQSGGQRIGSVDRYEVAVAQQLSGVHA